MVLLCSILPNDFYDFTCRKAYDFGILLTVYNFALVGLNYYITKEILSASKAAKYSYVCTPVKHDSYDPNEIRVFIFDNISMKNSFKRCVGSLNFLCMFIQYLVY